MASTYVNDLRLNEMATGDGSGTWGTTTNTNLELIGEALGYGTEAITTNADTHTTTVADGATDPGRAMYIEYTGTLDSACTITIAPNTLSRMHFIENGTSGSQNIIISQGSGANITIPPGDTKAVYLDGAGSGAAVVDAFASLNVVDLKVQDDLTVTDDLIVNGDIDLEGAIDVNGTANLDVVDIDGAVDMATTLQVDGVATFTGRDVHSGGITIANAGQIGSVGDTDAIAIASDGVVTLTQKLIGTELDISGDIDVDGTSNLDVVDIDGAVDMASTLAVAGVVTANAGVVVDNITIDGTQIDLSSGDLTLDVAGDIILDADGSEIIFADGGTSFGKVQNSSSSMIIESIVSDKDILFYGNDGGSSVLALTIDMSAAGAATFNSSVIATSLDISGDIDIDGTANLDIVDVDGAVNFAADVTYADGADIITASAGTSNFRAGVNAGNTIESGGNFNVVVGDEAGTAITTGDNNVGLGYAALTATTTGTGNTGIGFSALDANTTASDNTGVGANSLGVNTTGTRNTSVGSDSLDANTEGNDNTAVGKSSLSANTTASNNTAVGKSALAANTTGDVNVAVGTNALLTNITGTRNSALGVGALQLNTASDNVGIGYHALDTTAAGSNNTAVGSEAMDANTSGSANVAVGYRALDSNTTADNNVAIGQGSLGLNTTGTANVAIGHNALDANTTASFNFAGGKDALGSNTTGAENIAIGYLALGNNTTGTHNVAVGSSDGASGATLGTNDTGSQNTALGMQSLGSNTSADDNTAVGYRALKANTTGNNNTAVGKAAGLSVTTGTRNTFIGALAGDATDDGGENVAVGYLALSANCGDHNVAIGEEALTACTGAGNTSVGRAAGIAVTSGGNNIFIGEDAGRTGSPGGNITTGSNEIVLGDENITEAHIQVDWTVASDKRDKTDVSPMKMGLDFVNKLEPVTYKWDKRSNYVEKGEDFRDLITDGTHKEDWLDTGFLAQDVETLESEYGYNIADKTNLTTTLSDDGNQYGLTYSKFVPMLVKAVQELSAKIAELESKPRCKCSGE